MFLKSATLTVADFKSDNPIVSSQLVPPVINECIIEY